MARPNTLGARVSFSVVVTPQMADDLTRLAEIRGTRRAPLVRFLLREGLAKYLRLEVIAKALERSEKAV